MGIEWGQYEGSGNAMRVGIEVDWQAVANTDSTAVAVVRYYTQNNYSWSDDQSLRFGGAIDGTVGFHNGQGDNQITLRASRTYRYSYSDTSYGKSPGTRTFTASLSGAYNGITPSKSFTATIPARPIADALSPIGASVSRISDASQRITWDNRETAARPWDNVYVYRSANGGAFARIATLAGSASAYTDATAANARYQYRVTASNSRGHTIASETGLIYTSPAAPTSVARADHVGPPSGQRITWVNGPVRYTQYVTEIWGSAAGAAAVKLGEVGSGSSSQFDHTTDHVTHPYSAAVRWSYKVRNRTSVGTALYSAYTDPTTATAGATSPPASPINLSPSDTTVDPTRQQTFSWTHVPTAPDNSGQTAWKVWWRESGAEGWNEVTGVTATWLMPANTIMGDGKSIEWQVATRGADPQYGPFSESVTFGTAVTPIAPDPVRLPLLWNVRDGKAEASHSADEIRDFTSRMQSQLLGGGVKTVDSGYAISWSQRFIAIGLGRSANTVRRGYHNIVCPYRWTIAGRAVNANKATLTLTTTASTPMRLRVGEKIAVSGAGAPYDGNHVIRETSTSSATTATVTFDVTAANQSVGAAGTAGPLVVGHVGAADLQPVSGTIDLEPWYALYYSMPFGWGSGGTARKNGVVAVTASSITTEVATLTVAAPHYFAVNDLVDVSGVGAAFDGAVTITGVTATTISYARPGATGQNGNNTGLVTPSGVDTFFGNFHVVGWTGDDFVIPSNWILLAVHNDELNAIEWGTGDVVGPGYDSDSPVFKQLILTSGSDVTEATNNKPPLRIGPPSGAHMRVDGNEIQTMASNVSGATAPMLLNPNGGNVSIGENSGGSAVLCYGEFFIADHLTTASAANVWMNTSGRVYRSTSSLRYKDEVRDLGVDTAAILALRPHRYRSILEGDGDDDFVGFIAEEAAELGLTEWVEYDDEGRPDAFRYPQWAVALQAVCREQQQTIEALTARIEALES